VDRNIEPACNVSYQRSRRSHALSWAVRAVLQRWPSSSWPTGSSGDVIQEPSTRNCTWYTPACTPGSVTSLHSLASSTFADERLLMLVRDRACGLGGNQAHRQAARQAEVASPGVPPQRQQFLRAGVLQPRTAKRAARDTSEAMSRPSLHARCTHDCKVDPCAPPSP